MALGIGAHLTALRRTAAGAFVLKDAVGLSDLEDALEPDKFLLPIETLVTDLPYIYFSNERVAPTLNGMSTRILSDDLDESASIAVFSPNGTLIAVGVYDATESCIKPKIVLR
jgi:tRNA pseudouridine55 synthase